MHYLGASPATSVATPVTSVATPAQLDNSYDRIRAAAFYLETSGPQLVKAYRAALPYIQRNQVPPNMNQIVALESQVIRAMVN
jgi:hypothetical protein